ncbi:hypothetical protein JHS3_20880 [Jeongeupia sp. HS-3]|uniref:YbeD family protein n=1 Tax=Jeongeupia sp. HS-3 TaxID=1009682 RepID=UPI0018A50953|nr:DUF493 domain-containing protein [Jeongeupia sp. HS-3]BCL76352.1 hypothetical protein JHS3_20880 [Jeongeupia sp. HS-3]
MNQNNPPPPLEELVEFPAKLPIKAISHKQVSQDEFHAALFALSQAHVPGVTAEVLTIRASAAGNYFAATLMITFESADQVRALDAALRAHPLVRMVM